jgi:hypothetical protein
VYADFAVDDFEEGDDEEGDVSFVRYAHVL